MTCVSRAIIFVEEQEVLGGGGELTKQNAWRINAFGTLATFMRTISITLVDNTIYYYHYQ
jgi:hypothetical protein